MSLYVGLMSGTSMDGVDAALVDIREREVTVVSSLSFAYPQALQENLFSAINPEARLSVHEYACLDIEVGRTFANACSALLEQSNVSASEVAAIGSHGQTLRHSPETCPAYTVQIGDGATIAAQTRIDVVNDFRRLDVAMGGQGAPLVPAFHDWIFRDNEIERAVLNIGGISNITVLPKDADKAISGFDTGPGNCLMDAWIRQSRGEPYDTDGRWAASGHCSETLLDTLRQDKYFSSPIPKSTGREYFNLNWLRDRDAKDGNATETDQDVQATLLALTTTTIADAIVQYCHQVQQILVCGGGVYNDALMVQLKQFMPDKEVISTAELGADPAMIEASAFAWFAYCRKMRLPVRLTTSASPRAMVLGALHVAPTNS